MLGALSSLFGGGGGGGGFADTGYTSSGGNIVNVGAASLESLGTLVRELNGSPYPDNQSFNVTATPGGVRINAGGNSLQLTPWLLAGGGILVLALLMRKR